MNKQDRKSKVIDFKFAQYSLLVIEVLSCFVDHFQKITMYDKFKQTLDV